MTALADIYEDQIAAARTRIPAPDAQAYGSAKAILDSDIDAVYIATPPYMHPEHFELAVESGKHIFMEKPVAMDPAGIRRVLAAAKKVEPGQMVFIGLQLEVGKGLQPRLRHGRQRGDWRYPHDSLGLAGKRSAAAERA